MSLNSTLHLSKDLFAEGPVDSAATRDGFGVGMLEAAAKNKKIVGLTADLAESTRMHLFAEKYPERFIQIGVAEQNLATVASGLAAAGKIPFASAFAAFSPGRNWEQIRTTICYNNLPVIIVGSHSGFSVGEDGATHQALEDVATTRVMPNMTVIQPADSEEARKAAIAAAAYGKPVYLRLARAKTPAITTKDTPFEIGKAQVLWRGKEVTVIASGPVVSEALKAAHEVRKDIKMEVINVATIKPLDSATILRSVKKTGCVVTVEDHQVAGGLGGAVAELLAAELPTPMVFVGAQDTYGESGGAGDLWKKYGLTASDIIKAAKEAVKKK